MPGLKGIGPWGQIAQIEAAIFPSDDEVGMLEHGDIAAHPGMHIALHWDRDLFASKSIFHRRTWKLSFVPLSIIGRLRMNVVSCGILVDHVQLLVGPHRNHVRLIYAAFLLNHDGLTRRLESAIAKTIGDEDNYVLQSAAGV